MYDQFYRPPTRSAFPPAVKNLLIINALVFLGQQSDRYETALLQWFALWPITSYDIGVVFFPWQVVSYSFLHGGTPHLFFNLFALWMFGVGVENTWGSRRFVIFYFVCVIGAGLTQLTVATIAAASGSVYPTVGASGGVFGVLLAFAMLFPNHRIYLYFAIPIPAKWFVIGYGAMELFAGITNTQSGVAHFAHLGGMAAGFLLIQYWRGRLPLQPRRRMYW